MTKMKTILSFITLCFITQVLYANNLNCTTESLSNKSVCLYELGLINLSKNNYTEAIKSFTDGIQLIDDNYYKDNKLIDDSGQKLVLAEIEHRKGNLEIAANLYKGVLSTRISIIKKTIN